MAYGCDAPHVEISVSLLIFFSAIVNLTHFLFLMIQDDASFQVVNGY